MCDAAASTPVGRCGSPTASRLVSAAAGRLTAAGVASPRHDAEALAAHVLGLDRAALLTAGPMNAGQRADFDALVDRRAARVPLQHLTGVAYFRHQVIQVGPGVFVPRPETEALVDLVLPLLTPGAVVADLCAGSGAIALALAAEAPGIWVHAVEADPDAVGWLRRNALGASVTVHHETVSGWQHSGELDVVVSNPPYLPDGLEPSLEPEVAVHDPAAALWGGPDGMRTQRQVVAVAARLLRPGGHLAVEHDERQQAAVLDLLRSNGFAGVRGHQDLTGRDRFVTGFRP